MDLFESRFVDFAGPDHTRKEGTEDVSFLDDSFDVGLFGYVCRILDVAFDSMGDLSINFLLHREASCLLKLEVRVKGVPHLLQYTIFFTELLILPVSNGE